MGAGNRRNVNECLTSSNSEEMRRDKFTLFGMRCRQSIRVLLTPSQASLHLVQLQLILPLGVSMLLSLCYSVFICCDVLVLSSAFQGWSCVYHGHLSQLHCFVGQPGGAVDYVILFPECALVWRTLFVAFFDCSVVPAGPVSMNHPPKVMARHTPWALK